MAPGHLAVSAAPLRTARHALATVQPGTWGRRPSHASTAPSMAWPSASQHVGDLACKHSRLHALARGHAPLLTQQQFCTHLHATTCGIAGCCTCRTQHAPATPPSNPHSAPSTVPPRAMVMSARLCAMRAMLVLPLLHAALAAGQAPSPAPACQPVGATTNLLSALLRQHTQPALLACTALRLTPPTLLLLPCVPCTAAGCSGSPASVNHGSWACNATANGSSCTAVCNEGFAGAPTALCLQGTWQNTIGQPCGECSR